MFVDKKTEKGNKAKKGKCKANNTRKQILVHFTNVFPNIPTPVRSNKNVFNEQPRRIVVQRIHEGRSGFQSLDMAVCG